MAYEVNQGDQPQQVAGSSPLSQGGSAPAAQPQGGSQPSGQPSTPATIQTGASVNQAASQGAAQNKKSGSASSGMFTNVQKYVERNRPQAQKIAKAVTQDFSKQAGQIAQQVNKKKEDQQAKLTANQRLMEDQMKEAEKIVGGVMGTTPQPQFDPLTIASANEGTRLYDQNQAYYDWQKEQLGDKYQEYQDKIAGYTSGLYSSNDAAAKRQAEARRKAIEEINAEYGVGKDIYDTERFQADVDRFEALSKGPVGIQQVGDINLAQQNLKAQALANLAQGADREQFRRGLMQQTFGDRGYTRGQSALDDLIISGSQAAREQIIGGTKGAAEDLRNKLNTIISKSGEEVMAQNKAINRFDEDVVAMANNPFKKLVDDINARNKRIAELDVGSNISSADLAAMGLTADQVSNLYGVDPSDIFGGQGATGDELKKVNSLAELLNRESEIAYSDYSDKAKTLINEIAKARQNYETKPIEAARENFENTWGSYNRGNIREDTADKFQQIYEGTADQEVQDWWKRMTSPGLGGRYSKIGNETYQQVFDRYSDIIKKARESYKYGQGLTLEDKLARPTQPPRTGGTRK